MCPGAPGASEMVCPSACWRTTWLVVPNSPVAKASLSPAGENTPPKPEPAVSCSRPVPSALTAHTSVPQSKVRRVPPGRPSQPAGETRVRCEAYQVDPSGFILYRSRTPPASRARPIVLPSDDHANSPVNPMAFVRRAMFVPSAFTRYSSGDPVRSLT